MPRRTSSGEAVSSTPTISSPPRDCLWCHRTAAGDRASVTGRQCDHRAIPTIAAGSTIHRLGSADQSLTGAGSSDHLTIRPSRPSDHPPQSTVQSPTHRAPSNRQTIHTPPQGSGGMRKPRTTPSNGHRRRPTPQRPRRVPMAIHGRNC